MDNNKSAIVRTIKDVNSSVKPHQLCLVCREVLSCSKTLSGGEGTETFEHHKSCGALAESADNGCHLCSILLFHLQSEMKIDIQGISALDHGIKQSASSLQIRIFVRLRPKIRRIGLRNLQINDVHVTPSLLPLEDAEDSFATKDCREQIWRTAQDNAKLSVSTASDATFGLADTWIRHCLSNHYACKEVAQSDLNLPTRLIDLHGGSTADDVQLRLTKDLPRNINTRRLEYVTLSHRWGLSPTLRLLEGPDGTVTWLTTSIRPTDLPLTFRNAVVITRRLGHRYLWIDSLCIIQNSASDWAAESAIMGEIYRGSAFTIAALGAKDSYEGCFKSRNPLSYIPCYINPATHVKLRKIRDPVRLSGELLTRGWVIQERVLSPRTLFYGASGIYWECVQSQRTQDGLVNFGETPKADFCKLFVPHKGNLDIDNIKNPSESLIAFYQSWVELLQSYTSTRLTKQTDKLVAFQGIILSIARNRHYTSVAGLWKEFLPAELLWRTERPVPEKTGIYIAPSWSWASVESPVTNRWTDLVTSKEAKPLKYQCHVNWKVEIEDVQVKSMPNGRVKSASLYVRGPIRKLPDPEEESNGGLINQETEWAAIRGEYPIVSRGEYGFHDGTITRSKVFPDNQRSSSQTPLFVLWISRSTGTETRVRNDLIEPRLLDVGLVLEAEDHEKVFRRRGYFEQRFYGNARSYLFAEDQKFETMSICIH